MRLLLDEMLSPRIAVDLRAKGHEVEAINGHSDWESLGDPEVLDLARAERRALVTQNLVDFRPLHHQAVAPAGKGHYGMVFMPTSYRRTKAQTGKVVEALAHKLAQFPHDDSLVNAETWL